jgi:pimeloyl-ACP methyl ester carboxylesterase
MLSSYLYLNDLRVHYLHWKTESDESPVVMLHGLASNARIWELVAPYLVEGGLAPLAPDLRGHGLTDKPDGDYGFDSFRGDLAAFIHGLNIERPLLVGHSWGAMVVLDYAARFPFGPGSPSGIVLVDGGMTQLDASPGATWESMRDRLAPPQLAGTPMEAFLERLNAPNPRWRPDDRAVQIILANFDVDEDEAIYPRLSFEHHMQIVRAMWELKTYDLFSRIRCPVLLVPARPSEPMSPRERDFTASKERGVQKAIERNSKVQVHWMSDTIHDIPLQRPEALGILIRDFAASLPV